MLNVTLCTDKSRIHSNSLRNTLPIFSWRNEKHRELISAKSSRFHVLPLILTELLFIPAGGTSHTSQTRTWGSHSPQPLSALASFFLVSRFPVSTPREICPGLWEGRPRLRVSFAEVNVFNFAENAPHDERRGDGERERAVEKGNDDNATRRERRRPRRRRWRPGCLNRASLPRRLALFTVAKLADSWDVRARMACRGKADGKRQRGIDWALGEPPPSETYSARLWTKTLCNSLWRRA